VLINLFGIRVQKDKYELLRFVNSRHSIFLRQILASLGFLFTGIITRCRPLAIQSFHDFKNDDFKIGIRRAAKLLNIYKSQNVAKDETFNFCEELGISSLLALRKKFIAILSENGFDLDNLGDYLYVLGGIIEHKNEKKYIKEYIKIANKIILISTVAFIPGMNNVIIVNHGDYYTLYAKLKNLKVEKGDIIKGGQIIAELVTNSDGITQLQFQIWKNNIKLNPEKWIIKK